MVICLRYPQERRTPLIKTKNQVSLEVLAALLVALPRMQSILEIFSVPLHLPYPTLPCPVMQGTSSCHPASLTNHRGQEQEGRREGVGQHLHQDSSASILTPVAQNMTLFGNRTDADGKMESVNSKLPYPEKTTRDPLAGHC